MKDGCTGRWKKRTDKRGADKPKDEWGVGWTDDRGVDGLKAG